MASFFLKNVLDRFRAFELLRQSQCGWTVARPMRLKGGKLTGQHRIASKGVPEDGEK
ncbi:hypothetical protein [Metabacillus sp. 84]|uniref:hypothetical protein n=1 Tax=unclassified Metabacillus TaxID=2675274 RepID=UPI003CF580D4